MVMMRDMTSARTQSGTFGNQYCMNDAAAAISAAMTRTQLTQYNQPTLYPVNLPKIGSIRSRKVLAFGWLTASSAILFITIYRIIPPMRYGMITPGPASPMDELLPLKIPDPMVPPSVSIMM